MTDGRRIELFKCIEVTKDDILDMVEDGYDYTEDELSYLYTRLDIINENVIDILVEYDIRNRMVEVIGEITIPPTCKEE